MSYLIHNTYHIVEQIYLKIIQCNEEIIKHNKKYNTYIFLLLNSYV